MAESFPEFVGTEIDGTVVKAGDIVILKNVAEKNLSDYVKNYNGLQNVFTWKENSDGDIEKLYGGTDSTTFGKFYGYADGFSNYAVNLDERPPQLAAANGDYDGTGGPWDFRPYTNKGTITFGHYDLDMQGVSKFTVKFGLHAEGTNNDEWATCLALSMYLVQGDDGYKKDAAKQLMIYSNDTKSQATLYNGSGEENKFKLPASGLSDFLTFEFYVDTRDTVPRAKTALYDKSGNLKAETDWYTSDELSAFDFTESMGFKLHIQDNKYEKKDRLRITKFKFEKRQILEMVSTQEDMDGIKVPISKGSVSVNFDMNLDSIKLGDERIAVLDENGDNVTFTPTVSGTSLTLTFVTLEPESKYRIIFNGILPIDGDGYFGEISFKSSESGKLLYGSITKGVGKADVRLRAKNYSGTAKTYTFLLTVFKDGNMLPGVYYKKVKLLGRAEKNIDFSDISTEEAGDYTFKAYILDTFSGMNLISEGIAVTDAE